MVVSASHWVALATLALQGQGGAGKPVAAPPSYPFLVEPQDALWGHLSEGNFREPVGVFFEPASRELFVADSKNGLVGIFDAEYTPVFAFGSAATLIEPKAVFADREGTIFVLDSSRADIREFSYRGELKAVLPFARPQEKQGEPASSVVVGAFTRDSEGRWYVIDRELARAFVYSKERQFLREIPAPQEKGAYDSPVDIAVSPSGLVAIADQRGNPAIHVFTSENLLVSAFGGRDIGLSDFTSPAAVAFDEHDYLFAVDMLRHDVKVFTPAGKFLLHFGGWFAPETRGRAPGELLYPTDIQIAPDGPVFIAERFGQRVQVFERKPKPAASPKQ